MARRDEVLVLDMLIAARKIQRFSAGMTRDTLEDNEMAVSAIVREFQVIGEAARMVSDDFKTQHAVIPWKTLRGLRNRVIHEYFRVDLDILWQTIEDNLPVLITQLEPLVPDVDDTEKDDTDGA